MMPSHPAPYRALLLALGATGAVTAPSLADTRAPLQIGVTVRSTCQISSSPRQPGPGVTIRCPRGTPYALTISPPSTTQPVAVRVQHAQTITVIF
ncbi:MAG: hypothetical protein ABL877_12720 [Thiobacillus sp.]